MSSMNTSHLLLVWEEAASVSLPQQHFYNASIPLAQMSDSSLSLSLFEWFTVIWHWCFKVIVSESEVLVSGVSDCPHCVFAATGPVPGVAEWRLRLNLLLLFFYFCHPTTFHFLNRPFFIGHTTCGFFCMDTWSTITCALPNCSFLPSRIVAVPRTSSMVPTLVFYG